MKIYALLFMILSALIIGETLAKSGQNVEKAFRAAVKNGATMKDSCCQLPKDCYWKGGHKGKSCDKNVKLKCSGCSVDGCKENGGVCMEKKDGWCQDREC